jgi:Flp pilus assembly protein TadD
MAVFVAPSLFVPSGSATLTAERYLYLPAAGFALLVGAACGRVAALRPAVRGVAWGLIGLALVSLGAISTARARVWRDDLTLTADQIRTAPRSAFARDLRGQALLAAERWSEALEQFRQAVAIDPADAGYHNDLGIALRRLQRPDLAVGAFRELLRLDPAGVGTRLNLAYACVTLRDVPCIMEQRTALARLDPQALETLDAELWRWGLRPGPSR